LVSWHNTKDQSGCIAAAAAAAMLEFLQLLPNRLVSPGVRNLMPLLLWILGTIIWGVQAAQLQHHVSAGAGDSRPAVVEWRDTTLVSWHAVIQLSSKQLYSYDSADRLWYAIASPDVTCPNTMTVMLASRRVRVTAKFCTNLCVLLQGLSWANFGLFLTAAVMKLFQPSLSSCIDDTSITLGRVCPEGCLPACDACCCLDATKAKVPREVLRQGR
jgi:hypothetical protein